MPSYTTRMPWARSRDWIARTFEPRLPWLSVGHGKPAAACTGSAGAISASRRAAPMARRRKDIARHPTSRFARTSGARASVRRASRYARRPPPRLGSRMRRLAHAQELLDGPLDDDATLEGNLRDLARVNRLLGGTDLSDRALDALAGEPARGGRTIALLDV